MSDPTPEQLQAEIETEWWRQQERVLNEARGEQVFLSGHMLNSGNYADLRRRLDAAGDTQGDPT